MLVAIIPDLFDPSFSLVAMPLEALLIEADIGHASGYIAPTCDLPILVRGTLLKFPVALVTIAFRRGSRAGSTTMPRMIACSTALALSFVVNLIHLLLGEGS